MCFTFVGALKGADDTRFIMWSIGLATVLLMVLPMTILVELTDWGLWACWINLSFYVLPLKNFQSLTTCRFFCRNMKL